MLDLLPAYCGIERKFAMHYAQYTNARQAAIFCGYPPETAGRAGARLLKTKKVRAELALLNTKTQRESIMDIAELREWWTKIIRGERDIPDDLFEKDLTPRQLAIAKWHMQNDLPEQLKAAKALGESMGAFIERSESKVTVKVIYEDQNNTAQPLNVEYEVVKPNERN